MDYGYQHGGKVFTPNATSGIDPAENEQRNAALEAAELAEWQSKPERFAGYVVKKVITPADPTAPEGSIRRHDAYQWLFTTWRGKDLGQVFVDSEWRQYPPNARYPQPYRMRAITVKGNNGATYHGRYGSDWGQLCRVRKSRKG